MPRSDVEHRPDAETDWQRRRRLAEVFGDVLPDTTRDERPEQGGAAPDGAAAGGEDAADRWWREQVPPHHGG